MIRPIEVTPQKSTRKGAFLLLVFCPNASEGEGVMNFAIDPEI
jgi:hypothetical protein